MSDDALTKVVVETAEGAFVLGIDEQRAPLTAGHFLAYVDRGFLNAASVYRIVTLANQPAETAHKIEVFQWGWPTPGDGREPPLPPVAHEPTSHSGLSHRDGTLSLARKTPGSGGNAYFICIGDQPELDEGGRRNPDGAGFAAFGKVLEGADTVARIFARAEAVEYLRSPIPITRVARSGA